MVIILIKDDIVKYFLEIIKVPFFNNTTKEKGFHDFFNSW